MLRFAPQGLLVPAILRRGIGGPPVLSAEAQAIVAAMSPTPDNARQNLINNTVAAVVAAGAWALMPGLFVHPAHSQQAALVNWTNPAGSPALAVNSPAFTVDRGFQGDGVAAHIDYQMVQNAISGASQNSHHVAWYMEVTTATDLGGVLSGSQTSIARSGVSIRDRANTSTLTTQGTWPATGAHVCLNRGGSTGYDRYLNGTALTASVGVSAALVASNYCALRANLVYTPAGNTARAFHAGALLTAGQVLAVANALAAYMAAVGTT